VAAVDVGAVDVGAVDVGDKKLNILFSALSIWDTVIKFTLFSHK